MRNRVNLTFNISARLSQHTRGASPLPGDDATSDGRRGAATSNAASGGATAIADATHGAGSGAAAPAKAKQAVVAAAPARVGELQATSGGAAILASARLSPIVSADTEALMRRLAATASVSSIQSSTPVEGASNQARRGSASFAAMNANAASFSSSYNPAYYGSSPSFADLVLTKTAESLAATINVAAENANGIIVYGEAGVPLRGPALLELIASLRLKGEVARHWLRDGQHFAFVGQRDVFDYMIFIYNENDDDNDNDDDDDFFCCCY